MKVAYVASRYPDLSHTFIRREVEALRRLGVEVDTFTVRLSERSEHFGDADHREVATTTAILPASLPTVLRAVAAGLRRGPGAYLSVLARTVRSAPLGLRSTLWALFYFIEGTILWWHLDRRNLRHVHAHFANVGADVARVAVRIGRAQEPAGEWAWSFTMHGYSEFYEMEARDVPGKAADADAVVCISEYARSQLVMWTPPEAWSRFHVVHCGIDVHEFSPAPPRDDPGPLRLLFLGRLVVEKGPLVLIEAVALLRAAGVDVQLEIVGDGPARPEAERLVNELDLDDRVQLVGAVAPDQARLRYHDADVFCLPSFAEGVPVVLMEAMACALPVVTTYITGIPELVTDGVHGYTVTPGRADLVADAVGRLTDGELRRRMGAAGRAKVIAEFDITEVGPRLVEVFSTIG